MFCPNCGTQISEQNLFCPSCGAKNPVAGTAQPTYRPESQPYAPSAQSYGEPAPQPYADPMTPAQPTQIKSKKSMKKPLILGIGGVLLAALIGFGIWFLVRINRPDAKLYKAAQKSSEELGDLCHQLPNLGLVWDNLDAMSGQDAFHIGFAIQERMSMSFSNEDVPRYSEGVQFQGSVDYDKNAKQFGGSVTILGDNGDNVSARLYLDQTQVQLGSDKLLGEGEVVSVPLKDLGQQWNNSTLSRLSGVTLPEDLSVDLFSETDYEQALVNAFGDSWTRFEDSVEVTKFQGDPYFGTAGDTYTVTWDSAALQQMVPMAQQKLDQLEDITFEALMGSEAENITAYAIVTVLGQVDEHVDNIQAYVNSDGCLAGLYFHVVNDCALAIHLDGAENIWQHITVNYIPDANGDWQNEPETLEITTQIANGKMRITAAMQGDYDEGGAIEYNDADGTIRIISEDEDYDEEEETYTVAIRPNGNGVSFVVEYSMDYTDSWYDDDSSMTYSNSAHLEFVLAPLSGSIQALSANPRNLLSMTEQELEEFAMQCESNFESLDELFD